MECPKCGYLMSDFDKQCPKCKRLAQTVQPQQALGIPPLEQPPDAEPTMPVYEPSPSAGAAPTTPAAARGYWEPVPPSAAPGVPGTDQQPVDSVKAAEQGVDEAFASAMELPLQKEFRDLGAVLGFVGGIVGLVCHRWTGFGALVVLAHAVVGKWLGALLLVLGFFTLVGWVAGALIAALVTAIKPPPQLARAQKADDARWARKMEALKARKSFRVLDRAVLAILVAGLCLVVVLLAMARMKAPREEVTWATATVASGSYQDKLGYFTCLPPQGWKVVTREGGKDESIVACAAPTGRSVIIHIVAEGRGNPWSLEEWHGKALGWLRSRGGALESSTWGFTAGQASFSVTSIEGSRRVLAIYFRLPCGTPVSFYGEAPKDKFETYRAEFMACAESIRNP